MTQEEIDFKKLKRMTAIVDELFENRENVQLVRELISLAHGFTGMDKRRSRLEYALKKLDSLTQKSAKAKWWASIHSTVDDFTAEIAQYDRES